MNERHETVSHSDIFTKQAVLEAELRFVRAEIAEQKLDSREHRTNVERKLAEMLEAVSNLKGQRTIVAGVVSAAVSSAVALGAVFLKRGM